MMRDCSSTTYYRYTGTGRMMRDCCSTTYYKYIASGRLPSVLKVVQKEAGSLPQSEVDFHLRRIFFV